MKIKYRFIEYKKNWAIISFIFFAFMMLFHLTHSALWGDEWVEYNYSQADILNGDLYNRVIGTFQPPLYNFLMHFWLKIGKDVLWFRLFNVVIGCISFFFLYTTLNTLFNELTAAIVPCILAVCYQWIYCIQECSEYALMLCCLFGALMFYVQCFNEFSYLKMIAFISCCVLAIYSQYGSVFVALPLLGLFFFGNICNKEVSIRRKGIVCCSYIFSLVAFAGPLYFKFLKIQMENNGISNYRMGFSAELLKDIPFTFGKILAYMFNINSGDIWMVLFGLGGFSLSLVFVYILKNKRMSWTRLSLILCLLIGYVTHYFLVQLHIYAMTHPNQSAGFYARYSWFYIPIIFVAIPVLIEEYIKVCGKINALLRYATLILSGVVLLVSAIATINNWNKALDDQFAEIWIENEGWKDTTFLYGMAPYGFNYYVSHSDNYKEEYLDNVAGEADNANLPTRFWAWRTNWSGEGWQTTIDKAREQGYTVNVYNDSGYEGQLAYCYLE